MAKARFDSGCLAHIDIKRRTKRKCPMDTRAPSNHGRSLALTDRQTTLSSRHLCGSIRVLGDIVVWRDRIRTGYLRGVF